MVVLRHEWGTLHIGHGMKESPRWYEQLNVFFQEKILAYMLQNSGFFPVYATWLKNREKEFSNFVTMFDGHADHKEGKWWMCANNDELDRPVQDFVNEHDGKAMLILLLCCNPENHGRITSKNSLVVYSRSAMTIDSMESGRSKQFMHIPGRGDFIGTTDKVRLDKIAHEFGYQPGIV